MARSSLAASAYEPSIGGTPRLGGQPNCDLGFELRQQGTLGTICARCTSPGGDPCDMSTGGYHIEENYWEFQVPEGWHIKEIVVPTGETVKVLFPDEEAPDPEPPVVPASVYQPTGGGGVSIPLADSMPTAPPIGVAKKKGWFWVITGVIGVVALIVTILYLKRRK